MIFINLFFFKEILEIPLASLVFQPDKSGQHTHSCVIICSSREVYDWTTLRTILQAVHKPQFTLCYLGSKSLDLNVRFHTSWYGNKTLEQLQTPIFFSYNSANILDSPDIW